MAFSSDGTKLIVGYDNGTARLWEKHDSTYVILEGHTDIINSVAFSPDGTKILTTSSDGTARLWNYSGTQITVLKGHQDEIYFGAFSLDGSEIFTGSIDGTIKAWNIAALQFEEITGNNDIMSVAFSPNGKKIITGLAPNGVRLWNLDTKEGLSLGISGYVLAVAFSRDGSEILAASRNGNVMKWDSAGKNPKLFKVEAGGVVNKMSVAFTDNGSKVCAASIGTRSVAAIQSDVKDQNKEHSSQFPLGTTSLAFSPDGTKVLTSYRDTIAQLWTINGDLRWEFNMHKTTMGAVAFSPDGTKFITGSILWNLNGTKQKEFKHPGAIKFVSFSQDGTKILIISSDKIARLWNSDGILLWEFKVSAANLRAATLSPDGTKIVTVSGRKATLWNIPASLEKFLQNDRLDKLTAQQKKEYGINER